MNPESLLHKVAQLLRDEAEVGPGTMFVIGDINNVDIVRAPSGEDVKKIIARYDCEAFQKGLTAPQWAHLLKRLWNCCGVNAKGGNSGKPPTKKS